MKIKKNLMIESFIYVLILIYASFNMFKQFNLKNANSFSGFLIIGLSYAIIIIIIYNVLYFLKKIISKKDKEKKKYLGIFLLYFLYLIIIMLLIKRHFGFTGQTIHGDMYTIISTLKNFEFCSYQGWYSSIFYFIGLILFPNFLSNYAVVSFQIFVSSIFFTYVYSFFNKYGYGKIEKIIWIFANAIFPAAFFNQLCLRQLWFGQLIILLGIQILSLNYLQDKNKTYIKIMILTALIGVIRPEAIVYIPFVLFFLVFLNRKINLKNKLLYTFIIVFTFLLLRIPQKDLNEYKSTPILNPLSYLVSYDDLNWGKEENSKQEGIKIINKVFDYEALKSNSSYMNLDLAYNEPSAWHRDFSQHDFINLVKLYLKLIIYNPTKWLKGRWLTFSISFSNKGMMSYQIFFEKFIKNDLINFIIHCIYSPVLLLLLNFIFLCYNIYIYKSENKFVISSLSIIETIMIFIIGTSSIYMFIYPIWLTSLFINILFIGDIKERMS